MNGQGRKVSTAVLEKQRAKHVRASKFTAAHVKSLDFSNSCYSASPVSEARGVSTVDGSLPATIRARRSARIKTHQYRWTISRILWLGQI